MKISVINLSLAATDKKNTFCSPTLARAGLFSQLNLPEYEKNSQPKIQGPPNQFSETPCTF